MNKICKGCGHPGVNIFVTFKENYNYHPGGTPFVYNMLLVCPDDDGFMYKTSFPKIICSKCKLTGPQTGWRLNPDLTVQEWEIQKALGTLPTLTLIEVD